jgi:hypothetical protein
MQLNAATRRGKGEGWERINAKVRAAKERREHKEKWQKDGWQKNEFKSN